VQAEWCVILLIRHGSVLAGAVGTDLIKEKPAKDPALDLPVRSVLVRRRPESLPWKYEVGLSHLPDPAWHGGKRKGRARLAPGRDGWLGYLAAKTNQGPDLVFHCYAMGYEVTLPLVSLSLFPLV
jgi:hypothetical protein